jgi:hypothetical protein
MEIEYSRVFELSEKKSIYQKPQYIEMLLDILTVEKKHIICPLHLTAIPLLMHRTEMGDIYNSLPFFGSCGGLIGGMDVCQEISSAILNTIRSSDFGSLNIVSNWYNPIPFDEILTSFEKIERINTSKELDSLGGNPIALLNSYHAKTRNIVRASSRRGFRFEEVSSNFDDIIKMYFDEMNRRGRKPKPKAFWDYLMLNTSSGLDYVIYGAKLDGELLGFILFLYDTDIKQVEYFVPCATPDGRDKNVNYFLIHNALVEFMKQGFKVLHFGGSQINQDNLKRFKIRWGCSSSSYFYYNNHSTLIGNQSDEALAKLSPYFYIRAFSQT